MSFEQEAAEMIVHLEAVAAELPVKLTAEQKDKFALFAQLLLETNRTMNLTRIESPEHFAIKHVFDSLLCLMVPLPEGAGIDVGTGAGFPGIPLSIVGVSPITLLDSLAKRMSFLDRVIDTLGLNGIATIHARAEDAGRDHHLREAYSWAVARAVAPLPVLLEYTSPFVKVGGLIIAMKGPEALDELESAQEAAGVLKTRLLKRTSIVLPRELGERNLLVYEKVAALETQFPRRSGTPSKKPL